MQQPLTGRTIVVTRSHEQSGELVERLIAHGAEPLICPAIAFAAPIDAGPLVSALRRVQSYDWLIVTSANAVRFLFATCADLQIEPEALQGLRIAAIGPATALALHEHGATASFIPSKHTAEDLLAEIGPVSGLRILIPAADIARDALAAGLTRKGAEVDGVIAYRTIPGQGGALLAQALQSRTIDATTFTSPSTVQYLLEGLAAAGIAVRAGEQLGAIVCIGQVTSAAARSAGLSVAAEATTATVAGLVDALLGLFET